MPGQAGGPDGRNEGVIPRLQPEVLTAEEIGRIHGAMARILSRTGLAV